MRGWRGCSRSGRRTGGGSACCRGLYRPIDIPAKFSSFDAGLTFASCSEVVSLFATGVYELAIAIEGDGGRLKSHSRFIS